MPTFLYKYRTIDNMSLEALEGDFLFSAEPKQFIDLLEGPIEVPISKIIADGYQRAYDKLRSEYAFLPKRKINSLEDQKR